MAASEIRYTQVISPEISVEKLPDGTTAVLDQRSKDIHSLNSSATVVWEACKQGATLAQVRQALEAHIGTTVDEELAMSALSQLGKVKLIQSNAPAPEAMTARLLPPLHAGADGHGCGAAGAHAGLCRAKGSCISGLLE